MCGPLVEPQTFAHPKKTLSFSFFFLSHSGKEKENWVWCAAWRAASAAALRMEAAFIEPALRKLSRASC
jgi:hypothetical protein